MSVRVVLDTNVLVAAAYAPGRPAVGLSTAACKGHLTPLPEQTFDFLGCTFGR